MRYYCLIVALVFLGCSNFSNETNIKHAAKVRFYMDYNDRFVNNYLNIGQPQTDSGLIYQIGDLNHDDRKDIAIQYFFLPNTSVEMGNAVKGESGVVVYLSDDNDCLKLVSELNTEGYNFLDTIIDGKIKIKVLQHDSADPICCPTRLTYKYYKLANTTLEQVDY